MTIVRMGVPVTNQPGPRRHHYVPRCWLAGFTETGENDGRLWVTDFSRQKQWPSTPDNAGHMRDFYRLSDESPDPVIVEKFFSALEGAVAPVLKSLDQERRPPNEDELDAVLTFMAYQFVRLPSFRPFVLNVLDRVARERLVKELRTPDTWRSALTGAGMDPDAPGADYESAKRFFDSGTWNIAAETDWYMQRAFKEVDGILGRLRERHWGTSITQKGRLIASDNPIVLEGERGQLIGFRNADFVLYPVSRHMFLTGTREPLQKPPHNFYYFALMNTMTLRRADAQVYSHIPDFVWLDESQKMQTNWKLFTKDEV